MSDTQNDPGMTHDSVVFSVRVPLDLAARIARAARDEKKKRNGWIVDVLAERVAGDSVPVYAEGAAAEGPKDPKPPPPPKAVDCKHPRPQQTKLEHNRWRCGLCGTVLTTAGRVVR